MVMDIRPATAEDIPAITAIYGHWVEVGTSSFELQAPDEAEMLSRFTALKQKDLPWLAATRGGALVGYAYAGLYRPRPAYRFTLEDSIYVAPDAVGTGIGRPLLTTLIETCRGLGCRNLIGIVGDPQTNQGSVALHRALGFEPIGTARQIGFKFDCWLDVLTMQKVL